MKVLGVNFFFETQCRNIDMLKRAFIVYVRPLLEYNSVVWSPYYKQDIETMSVFNVDLPMKNA